MVTTMEAMVISVTIIIATMRRVMVTKVMVTVMRTVRICLRVMACWR